MSRSTLRLLWAIVISALIHLVGLTPWRWPFVGPDDDHGRQTPILTSVRLMPPVRPPDPTRKVPPVRIKGAPPKGVGIGTKLTSSAPGAPVPAGAGSPAPAPGEDDPSPDSEVVALDQPLPPAYPEEAMAGRLEGCVLAAVSVSPAGEVDSVEILAADVPRVFDQAVIDSQMAAHYLPARRGGEAVASRVLTVAAFVIAADRRMNCAKKYAPLAEKFRSTSAPPGQP